MRTGTKELLTPRDLTLYREDEPSVPFPELPVTDETGPRAPNNESIPENGEATASPRTDEDTQRTDTDMALAENMLSMPDHSSNSS